MSSTEPINLEILMTKLNQWDEEAFVFIDEEGIPGYFCSYRGFYDEVCLTISTQERFKKVKELKNSLKEFMDKGSMEGYKGGNYPIELKCKVYVSEHNTASGFGIYKFEKGKSGYLILKTKDFDNFYKGSYYPEQYNRETDNEDLKEEEEKEELPSINYCSYIKLGDPLKVELSTKSGNKIWMYGKAEMGTYNILVLKSINRTKIIPVENIRFIEILKELPVQNEEN